MTTKPDAPNPPNARPRPILTVGQLIEHLFTLPLDLPVRVPFTTAVTPIMEATTSIAPYRDGDILVIHAIGIALDPEDDAAANTP